MRDFRTRTANEVFKHNTGRKCEGCGEELFDTIVNFGENLPERDIDLGFEYSQIADLHICFGTSLRVSPANQMPETTTKKPEGKLVIVNLQPTPLDDIAFLRIWGLCDVVIEALMKKLNIEIPEFILTRRLGIRQSKGKIIARGLDVDRSPFTLFKKIVINNDIELKKEPFVFETPKKGINTFEMTLHFMGHYGEPPLKLDLLISELPEEKDVIYKMEFSPKEKKWINIYEDLSL